jgi:hypothetical protein
VTKLITTKRIVVTVAILIIWGGAMTATWAVLRKSASGPITLSAADAQAQPVPTFPSVAVPSTRAPVTTAPARSTTTGAKAPSTAPKPAKAPSTTSPAKVAAGPPSCTVGMSAHDYQPGGQAAYSITSDLGSQPYEFEVTGNGVFYSENSTTGQAGNAAGSFTAPSVDQVWYVSVYFPLGPASCTTSFIVEGTPAGSVS